MWDGLGSGRTWIVTTLCLIQTLFYRCLLCSRVGDSSFFFTTVLRSLHLHLQVSQHGDLSVDDSKLNILLQAWLSKTSRLSFRSGLLSWSIRTTEIIFCKRNCKMQRLFTSSNTISPRKTGVFLTKSLSLGVEEMNMVRICLDVKQADLAKTWTGHID